MDSSVDYSVSSLLCTEDTSFFDENECFETVVEQEYVNGNENNNQSESSDGLLFPLLSDEALSLMLEKECLFMPSAEYLNRLRDGDVELQGRKQAIDWILKVNDHFGFGPLCAYLSINYLDRFLSAFEIPEGKAWTMQLLAVACLSLAAKMEETEVPPSLNLQIAETKFIFEAKTIQRMELLVLSTLKWRMQAVTPFSFTDNFIHRISVDQFPPPRSSMLLAIQLIMRTMQGIDFLEFRPSETAAAVALLALKDNLALDIEMATSVLPEQVEKGRVVECVKLFHELALINGCNKRGNGSESLVPQSPVGVLDAACFSYRSDITMAGSCASSASSTPGTKRRKLNTPHEVEL